MENNIKQNAKTNNFEKKYTKKKQHENLTQLEKKNISVQQRRKNRRVKLNREKKIQYKKITEIYKQ